MILCARCDAVVEHLNALLGHYQEVHGRVPKPRFFSADGCNTSATGTPCLATQRRQELLRRISELMELCEAVA